MSQFCVFNLGPQLIVKYSKSCIGITWFSWAVLRITLLSQETAKSPGRSKSRDPIGFLLFRTKVRISTCVQTLEFSSPVLFTENINFLRTKNVNPFFYGDTFLYPFTKQDCRIDELVEPFYNHSGMWVFQIFTPTTTVLQFTCFVYNFS